MNLSTRSSAVWAACTQITQQGSLFVLVPFLSRYLNPTEFGIIAIVQIVIQFGNLLCDFGTGAAVTREPELTERFYSTSMWINFCVGLALTAILIQISSPLAALLGDEDSAASSALALVAVQFVFLSALISPQAVFRREMKFRAIFIIETLGAAIYVGFSIFFMSKRMGVESIIISQIFSAGFKSLLYICGSSISFRFECDRIAFARVIGFSAGLGGFNLINFWARRADQILIAHAIGQGALGIYSMAYRIMMLPLTNITYAISAVMLPGLAPFRTDSVRLKTEVLRWFKIISLLTFPMMSFLWLGRNQLVTVFLGEKWRDVSELIAYFSVVGLVQSVIAPVGVIYTLTGKTKLFFLVGCINTAVVLLSFLVGIKDGILGLACLYLIANIIMIPLNVGSAMRLISASIADWLSSISGALTVFMILVPFHFVIENMPDIYAILVSGVLVLTFNGIYLWWFERSLIKSIVRIPSET